MAQPLSNKRALVSYSAAPSVFSSGHWDQIHRALASQLPLRNIHWKSASRTSLRTIQELDVALVHLDTLRDDHTSQIPATLLEKPFLNIYIVTCEDTDNEVYRATVKKQVKEWHTIVSTRKNQEWLILHIVRPDAKTPSGNFFQLKGSVLDKLKADFNTDKRDRCIQISWSTASENPAAWGEFINKLKDGILSAFDAAVALREEEVKRSESQRQMPGWNFCTFFILKESLAASFEGVNLFEDALLQYDELEASFYQVLKEKNLSWFGTLITPGPKDDSAPLLSISKKSYRDLILANTISVFDFRVYLLARQCELLAKMGSVTEVCKKVGAFLGAFGRRLREIETTLPQFFVESWTYSSALSVVEQCDSWSSSHASRLEGNKLVTFNAGKGELLERARNQLDIIGILVGHLPSHPPFSSPLLSTPGSPKTSSPMKISNTEVVASLEDRDVFYELYIRTTNRAIDMYAKAGRRKFALKMHGSLAALDVHRQRLPAALTTYTSLPAHYAPHMWTSLESLMLSRALDVHTALGKPKDREWMHILLSFLKAYVEGLGGELLMREEDKTTYVTELVKALKTSASELDTDFPHPDHPALSISTSQNARSAEGKDGSFLDVTILNRLPCALPVSDVTVTLAGPESERLKFHAPVEVLPPGNTLLTLFCPTPSFGAFLLDSSEVRASRLLLQWTYRKASAGSKTAKGRQTLVRIPRDLSALDVRIHQPDQIELGHPPALGITISTGRNHISSATIQLSAPSATFHCQKAVLQSENAEPLETTTNSVTLVELQKGSSVTFLVPHSDATAFHALKVKVEVEYTTQAEPTVTRSLQLVKSVVTVLPISVNVEDFFRGKRLFSKFTVSTTSHQHVRISEAHLEPPVEEAFGLKVTSCSSRKRGVVTVTPSQPANFLFSLDSADGPVRDPLSLKIRYRMLREEVEAVIEKAVETLISESPSLDESRRTLVSKLVEALELDADWVELYGLSGELIVPGDIEIMGQLEEPLERLRQSLRKHRHVFPPEGPWHEIRIPVDVPNMNIVAAARIQVTGSQGVPSDEPPRLYAGQPISALLTIQTSFHWGSNTNDVQYVMQFDVEEMVREWLVSGKKRGHFVAKDDSTFSTPITLIALHHGELALPKVTVLAAPLTGELTMGSMAIPSTETYQLHGAEKVMVLPRGGRSTFLVGMGSS